MKNYFKIAFVFLLMATFLVSCGKKLETPKIEGLTVYTDAQTDMSLKIPKNWYKKGVPGLFVISIPNKGLVDSYGSYNTEATPGAIIRAYTYKLDSTNTVKIMLENHRQAFKNCKSRTEKEIFIDGVKGTKFTYKFPLMNGYVDGIRIIAAKDSGTATEINIECFGSAYEIYKPEIEKILKSVKLGITKAIVPDSGTTQAEPPTMKLVTKSGDGFSIGIPDNFYQDKAPSMKGATSTLNFAGDRRGDCNIRVDVLNGSNVTDFANQVENNKSSYGGKSPVKTTLGGKTAYKFDYNPVKNINSKVWYVKNGGKIFVITINYYIPEKDKFLPPFEKAVNSIKFN